MSECIVKSDGTKGSIDFYDPITNRYFIHCGDAYSWQDPWNLTFEKDFKSPETAETKRRETLLNSIGRVGVNESASPDAILSLMLRSECDLLHADILKDMRRLEMLNFVKRRKREKEIQESRKRLQDLHVPYASRFHEQPICKPQVRSVNWTP
ncbi:hypothetical protein WA538_001608, partial [Blastocystis sp. DL]